MILAQRGRPSDDLLRCARATGAAWSELRKAEAALDRHADRSAPELKPAVTELRRARSALLRAYDVLSPGKRGRRTLRVGRAPVRLWRCRYCPALVFTRDRRVHLQYDERIHTDGLEDAQLEAHFTAAPEAEDGPPDDEEDELAGW